MNCFCIGSRKPLTQKFNVLLVHVVGSTPQSALRHSIPFAIQLVKDFFIEHTQFDIDKITELSDRFRNLEVDPRLEIEFKGKPKRLEVPSHAVFTHQSEYGIEIFEVETRVTSRYIQTGAECLELGIERTDYLNYIIHNSEIRSQLDSRRVSYTPHFNNGRGKVKIVHQ